MNGKNLQAILCVFLLPVLAYAKPAKTNPRSLSLACHFHDEQRGNYSLSLTQDQTEELIGGWVRAGLLVAGDKTRLHDGLQKPHLVWLLESPKEKLIEFCYSLLAQRASAHTHYLSVLQSITAYGDAAQTSKPRPVVSGEQGHYYLVYREKSAQLRKDLKKYNFAIVLPGIVYRSQKLGKKGIDCLFRRLEQERLPLPKSIASIHVMGFGGKGGSYNLEELEEAQRRGLTFLFSYAFDKKHTVYMDGLDPSHIDDSDPDHGNIYLEKTLDRFIPDPKVRQQLRIQESLDEGRVLKGDTEDFLASLENMIEAPWPILIHCKGGRHKTGVFCIIFEYLAYTSAMSAELAVNFVIPAYQSRLQLWWEHRQGSLWQALFAGPWSETLPLYPAERHYAEHNVEVFRETNIAFARGLIEGRHLTTPGLKKQWERIQRKFAAKAAQYPHFSQHLRAK